MGGSFYGHVCPGLNEWLKRGMMVPRGTGGGKNTGGGVGCFGGVRGVPPEPVFRGLAGKKGPPDSGIGVHKDKNR